MWVKTWCWSQGGIAVRVPPGRDEGRREALLGGEMSQCVSVSSDLALNIAWYFLILCAVSHSDNERINQEIKWNDGKVVSLSSLGVFAAKVASLIWTNAWLYEGPRGQTQQCGEKQGRVCLAHLCCQKSIHCIGASQIRPEDNCFF